MNNTAQSKRSPQLEIDTVAISLQERTLLKVDTRIPAGSVLTVMGPSGSGKSTLLAFIGGFLDPAFKATGTIRHNGVVLTDLPAHERHVGILFQDALLFPHMSVLENLMFAVPSDIPKRRRRQLADEALEEVGLGDAGPRDPGSLSGGQQARVALMRVLLASPRALLLDEPFSKLDAGLRSQIRTLVFDKAGERGLPVLLVTHDQDDARAAGGPILSIGSDAVPSASQAIDPA